MQKFFSMQKIPLAGVSVVKGGHRGYYEDWLEIIKLKFEKYFKKFQYEWSHRAKSREMVKHVHAALGATSNDNAGSVSPSPHHSTGTDSENGEGSSESETHFENLMVNY